jgi:lipoic acid synthetase
VTPDSAFSVQPAAPGAARYTENGERRLRVRWLGKVAYDDALALQRGLFAGTGDHLLLLEHPPVYTLGVRADPANVLVPPAAVGAELVRADRGGDVTYHGPGQLVGYPVVNVPGKRGGGMADTVAYVRSIAELLIDVLADLGLDSRWDQRFPGVWVDGRKIAAIGVRLSRGRSMHGFALNVDPDLTMFDHIVPCGLDDRQVTSLRAEGLDVSIDEVVELVATHASARWGAVERQDATRFQPPASDGAVTPVKLAGRLAQAGVVGGLEVSERKPEWLRAPLRLDVEQRRLQRTMRELDLVTVCEEAGCPNLSECWSDGTATFMINGERCTRACGFCLVDTRHPEPLDVDEPERVAEAVARMGLTHAVVTAVARDDLPDGGAGAFARTIEAIRRRRPGCAVEVLISDCKGAPDALDLIYAARPDVLNHNVETVLRLQRAVRPSAGYARSLAVLARAKAAGLTTKSGIILGMGETDEEVVGALADLRGIGVDIVTLGQYLRPTARHLPVARWVRPETFTDLKAAGEAMGIPHVEASPLTRSSYHAKQAAEATA